MFSEVEIVGRGLESLTTVRVFVDFLLADRFAVELVLDA